MANHYLDDDSGYGYSLIDKNGIPNTRRYIASLDYSLDQIKLNEVYQKVYRRRDMFFKHRHKRYSSTAMVVTFKYSVNEFNRKGKDRYIKFGYDDKKLRFDDAAAVVDGQLVGIILNQEISHPLSQEVLGKYFGVKDGKYILKKNPKVLMTTANLRHDLYNNGFCCGGIHYRRWKRSSGSSRVGKCLFIDDNLFPAMHKWDMCGIDIQENQEVDLAALESYISLTTSSIIDTLPLDPQHILVIDDFESVFKDDVISVEEKDGRLTAENKTCEITNSIWDGQGLIDIFAMGAYQDKGMVLLRNSFFKCCCFNTNLQQWFHDNGITDISQLNGTTNATRIEDIKLVTTPSSIKYLKFGTLQQWRDNASPVFGVVKHDKKTHFFDGRMVQTHYQLLNTLQMTQAEVETFLQPTLDYLTALKTEPAVVRNHIAYPIEDVYEPDITPVQSKNDVIYKMLGVNDRFAETKLYDDFVKDIVRSQLKSIRLGHILVSGNYSTLFGNPFEMLLATIGRFTGVSTLPVGAVHSTRFQYGCTLCGSRSPHITMSNVWLPLNVEAPDIDTYFNLTQEILCINSIGENVLQRLSGCDFDSDSVLLTDNPHIINAALKNYNRFPIAACNVSAQKIKRRYCAEQQADLDIKTANNLIGNIINLSQELNTRIWDMLHSGATVSDVMPIYCDVCKLNAAQGIEIDKAKKEYIVNNSIELSLLSDKYSITDDANRKIKPAFFAAKDKGKGYYNTTKKNYAKHHTTMDYLQTVVNSWVYVTGRYLGKKTYIPLAKVIDMGQYRPSRVSQEKILAAIAAIEESISDENAIYDTDMEQSEKFKAAASRRQECIETIGNMTFGASTMIALLLQLEEEQYKKVKRRAFSILFGYPNSSFYHVIDASSTPIKTAVEADDGDVTLYGFRYKIA